jgi:hypothetical protein
MCRGHLDNLDTFDKWRIVVHDENHGVRQFVDSGREAGCIVIL